VPIERSDGEQAGIAGKLARPRLYGERRAEKSYGIAGS
jgi:hypothetical protein